MQGDKGHAVPAHGQRGLQAGHGRPAHRRPGIAPNPPGGQRPLPRNLSSFRPPPGPPQGHAAPRGRSTPSTRPQPRRGFTVPGPATEAVVKALADWTSDQVRRYGRRLILDPDLIEPWPFYNPESGSYVDAPTYAPPAKRLRSGAESDANVPSHHASNPNLPRSQGLGR